MAWLVQIFCAVGGERRGQGLCARVQVASVLRRVRQEKQLVPQGLDLLGVSFVGGVERKRSAGQGLGFVEFQSPLGERTSTYVRCQGAYRSFSERSAADNSNLSLLFGVRSSRWEGLDLALAAGVGAVGFDSFVDALRALGELSLGYRLPSGWRFSLEARHLMTPNLAVDDAMESTGELGVEKRFGAATAVSLRLFVTRFDGDVGADAANLFGGTELRIRRQITRRLQLALSYRHWRNRGALELDDFSQNRIALELAFRL